MIDNSVRVFASILDLEDWRKNRIKASTRRTHGGPLSNKSLDIAIDLLKSYLELIEFVESYDKYIVEVVDREDGSVPVCVSEYFHNEWQKIKSRQNE